MRLALLLLAAGRVGMIDEVVRVPAGEWRALDLVLKQQAAVIECRFSVLRGGSPVFCMTA